MIVRATLSIAAAAALTLVLPPAAHAQVPSAQPAAAPGSQNQSTQQMPADAPRAAPEGRPIKVYLRAGLKTHAAGQHDYPQFLADWSKLLTERGAVVNGALRPPTREDLDKADVVVIYKGDVGYLTDADKAAIEAYVQRGGGLVSLHDALCG